MQSLELRLVRIAAARLLEDLDRLRIDLRTDDDEARIVRAAQHELIDGE